MTAEQPTPGGIGDSGSATRTRRYAEGYARRLNFETTKGPGGQRPQREPTGVPGFSTGTTTGPSKTASEDAAFKIPAGSRKSALVHLALAAWHAGELDPLHLGEVRGRKVDEARLQRALYRSSMGEIEHALGVP